MIFFATDISRIDIYSQVLELLKSMVAILTT